MEFSSMTNIKELFSAGGPILILLLLLSIYSISIILERFFKLRSIIRYSRRLMEYCKHPIRSYNYNKIADACKKEKVKNTPAAILLSRLVKTSSRPASEQERVAESVIDFEIASLQRKLTVLGTLGSITPFIGLFGTVIGVMHAFKDLAATTANGAGASVVAAGIAESETVARLALEVLLTIDSERLYRIGIRHNDAATVVQLHLAVPIVHSYLAIDPHVIGQQGYSLRRLHARKDKYGMLGIGDIYHALIDKGCHRSHHIIHVVGNSDGCTYLIHCVFYISGKAIGTQ